ncbi:MAG TPA: PAS domain S-box protein, partial [Methanoregula sp.]|nr:PAS domain S-box protein [Methanoregula sp.]
MVLNREITARIREVLEQHPEGISITDLVGSVDINRNTAGRYLESMLLSGQVEMRRFGMAKLYTLAQRLPVSSVLSISSELVLQLDFGMRVLYANDPLLAFLGIPAAKDLFGKNIEFTPFSVVFEEVFPDLLDRFRRGLRGEEWHGELPRPVRRRFFFCRIAPTVTGEGLKGVSVLLEDITDQKRDEERIRTSEARLRSIFRVSPVGIGVVADRIFFEVNDRFCEMTGHSAAELIGKSARLLYPSDEAFERVGTQYYSQIRQSGAGSLETRWVKKDGTVIDVLLNTIPLDPASISGGITFTALDITERKKAEENLRQSEERLQLALTGSEMGMWELDILTGKGSGDDRCSAIFGYSKEDTGRVPLDWEALTHPDDLPLVRQRLADYLSGKTAMYESEHRMRHASGSWIWIIGRGRVIPSLPDGSRRILGTMLDVTERRQAGEALRESEEKYRYLVERSLQGLTILQDGRPVFANSAMLEISGYPYEEYLQLSPEEMMATVHPDDRHLVATVMADRLNAKNIPAEHEFRILRKDGTVRWVLTHGSLISYHGAPAIQIAYLDITDRKRAEQALVENEERIRQITETLTSVFYVHDRASDRFVYVSPAYEKIWKRSCQSLYDNPYSYLEAVHPDDLPRLLESIRRELEDDQYLDTDYRILQPDGTVRWIHAQNFPILDARGVVYRVAGIAEDITARRTAEDALRESEEKYRHVVEQSLQGLTIIQDGRHVYANPAMLGILGRSQEEYAATDPEALFEGIHPDDRDRVLAVARDNMEGRTMSAKAEFRFVRKDGGIRWIL